MARLRRPISAWVIPDAVRLPAQTVMAVLCAYTVMGALDMPEITWGAFSALFVVRASLEGTAGEACARVAGALVGVAIGVALVATDPLPWPFPWTIAVGVALMSLVAVRWPILNYGLVTVAIITVAPEADLLEGAWNKSLAILIGSASGVAAALAVLPLSARRQARYKLAESVEVLGEIVAECSATFIDCRATPRTRPHSTVEPASESAREMLREARTSPFRGWADARTMRDILDSVDGLWRVLPILDRATGQPLSEPACKHIGAAFHDMADAFRRDMHRLAQAIRQRGRLDEPVRTHAALVRLEARARDEAALRALDARDREAIGVARWAWRMLVEQADALQAQIGRARGPG